MKSRLRLPSSAVLATWANLVAAGCWIPGFVRPPDFEPVAIVIPQGCNSNELPVGEAIDSVLDSSDHIPFMRSTTLSG